MTQWTQRFLGVAAVTAAFLGIAIALALDAGLTARWSAALSRRDGPPVEAGEESEEEEAAEATRRPAP